MLAAGEPNGAQFSQQADSVVSVVAYDYRNKGTCFWFRLLVHRMRLMRPGSRDRTCDTTCGTLAVRSTKHEQEAHHYLCCDIDGR